MLCVATHSDGGTIDTTATTGDLTPEAQSAKVTGQFGDFTVTGNDDGTITISQTVAGTGDLTGVSISVVDTSDTSAATGAATLTRTDAPENAESITTGTLNVSTTNVFSSNGNADGQLANTVLDLTGLFSDGTKIRLGDTEYTIALGPDSKFKNVDNVVDLTDYNSDTLDEAVAARRLTAAAKDNATFSVGHSGTDASIGLQQLESAKDSTDMTTMDKLASYIGVSTLSTTALNNASVETVAGKSLTLQIGPTADSYNQLKVNISDYHAAAIGIGDIDISTQEGAAAAVDAIKAAVNYVSDVRGTLGATQNSLDHTINNLSVMTENIQDAESTIRDVDVAEEMMAYTKNKILIQSAQAMLAQAIQVPQGVLQLLQ